ncbi:MAG TPA: HAMP domain-containing sensor histidine kinase [Candidatus Saccharimonadales bacterium]|nr:HAMP domain-containing sensor histidine kinase [Candidatus Saccharimonadales bacterium]
MSRFYKRFIEPRQRSEDVRNRELVLNVLLAGTVALFALAFALLLVSLAAHNSFVLTRTIVTGIGLLAAVAAYRLSRSGKFTTAAFLLIGLYMAIATGAAYRWGVTVPTGLLLFGLVLVLSGIVLGAKSIPYAMGCVVLIIVIVRTLQVDNTVHPDFSAWAQQPLNWGTVIGCIMIFGILATVSWLYTSQMERSLRRARRAEAALRRQAQMLEVTVERRTRELQDAQLEKVQQMYRFAELGQLSTALLHDLANHLTTLSLDIEGLEEQNRSRMLQRAKRSIRYIDDMVGRVRDQLHGRGQIRAFNVTGEIQEIVDIMKHRAQDAGVRLQWEAPADKKSLRVRGESVRFRQLMANLVSNAIDAYTPQTETGQKRDVLITAEAVGSSVSITVNDWGRGIPPETREKLFEPFFSTKKTGMGMGLFIAKQFTEDHFGGKLVLSPNMKHTAFRITIPRE